MELKVNGYFKPRFHFSAASCCCGWSGGRMPLLPVPSGDGHCSSRSAAIKTSHKIAHPMSKQNAVGLCLDVPWERTCF